MDQSELDLQPGLGQPNTNSTQFVSLSRAGDGTGAFHPSARAAPARNTATTSNGSVVEVLPLHPPLLLAPLRRTPDRMVGRKAGQRDRN